MALRYQHGPGDSPDLRHLYGLRWYHGSWTPTQIPVTVGPWAQIWPSTVAQPRHHMGPGGHIGRPYQPVPHCHPQLGFSPWHTNRSISLLPCFSTTHLFVVAPTCLGCLGPGYSYLTAFFKTTFPESELLSVR